MDTIKRQVKQMSALIENLLRLARTSRATLRKQKIDLGALLSEVREQLAADATGRNVTWNIGALPEVQADAVLMRQVLANLIANALKFTLGRDPAVIAVGLDDAAAKPGEVVIFVRDNGAGFDMQHADRLFTPFHRMHSESEFEGTGVGLANVQRIIERHGGRIWANATAGQGATFSFALPA
jgi:signal transduction histidine kinase